MNSDMIAEMAPASKTDNPARFISIARARCIARYRMKSVPGRPEELVANSTGRQISFAYCGGEMRIRKHGGRGNREWVEVRDFRLRDGWLREVYEFLDAWMGYIPERLPRQVPPPITRPIRDIPKA